MPSLVEKADRTGCATPLKQDAAVSIVGLLADGRVVGQVSAAEHKSGDLIIWKQNKTPESLPWIAGAYCCGSVQGGIADMSRYIVFATKSGDRNTNHLLIFDRALQKPIVDSSFPENGRAD